MLVEPLLIGAADHVVFRVVLARTALGSRSEAEGLSRDAERYSQHSVAKEIVSLRSPERTVKS